MPFRGLGIRPLVSAIQGFGNLPRGAFVPRKGSQGLRGASSGASKRCVRLQQSKERKVGNSEALKRPLFPECPLKEFQPSASYPRATDRKWEIKALPSVMPHNISMRRDVMQESWWMRILVAEIFCGVLPRWQSNTSDCDATTLATQCLLGMSFLLLSCAGL